MIARSKIVLLVAIVSSLLISTKSALINPYYYDIILSIGINIILAVSLNLVNGHTGQFSLGHAGFMAVGAYSSAAFTAYLSRSFLPVLGGFQSVFANELFFLLALLTAGIAAAVAGLLVGVPSLRLKGDYLAIVTLGFGEIIRVIIQNTDAVGASRGFSVTAGYTNFAWTYICVALTVYIIVSLVNSTYGRGFLTVRDDEVAAEAMGINTTKYKVIAFMLAAFFAGIAGGLYAHFKQFIHPEGFNFLKSIDVVVMVILGGMGNTVGVIIAAILLTILPEWLRTVSTFPFLPHWLQEIARNRMILYSLLLIVLMLTRPQGLFGGGEKFRRWFARRKINGPAA
jgi:branched-chain amino acid transport system permease protein